MAEEGKPMVPITREFLKKFYEGREVTPIPQTLKDLDQKITESCVDYGLTFSEAASKPKNKLIEKDELETIQEAVYKTAPHKLDENVWRMREQCEEISATLSEESVTDLRSVSKAKSVSLDPSNPWVSNLIATKNYADEIFQLIRDYQTNTLKNVEGLVQTFAPKDQLRLTIIKMSRERTESSNTSAIDSLIKRGGSIHEKYDLYWDQQLARRQTLVNIGEATGPYKWVIKYLGGVPEPLLDFIKQINAPEGPMEELRIKYGPIMYFLFLLVNKVRLSVDLLTKVVGTDSYKENVKTLNKQSEDIMNAAKGVRDYIKIYFDEMLAIMRASPFFITKEQADGMAKSEVEEVVGKGKTYTWKKEVKKGEKVRWSWKTKGKDIGWRVIWRGANGEEKEVVKGGRRGEGEKVKGEWEVENDGEVEMEWDNTFSYFTSKTIVYDVKVEGGAPAEGGADDMEEMKNALETK
eukprot:TRINITY_DN4329_c0_g1_i1.p1 TRINITY_DN4329_c0_g1~~TRINITY_DN4329_c0_g1_i1.p1  ORF type:complete len:465 (-),score=153.82 TRINITY_DN4329_c0_g1_i1:70-1464(-)